MKTRVRAFWGTIAACFCIAVFTMIIIGTEQVKAATDSTKPDKPKITVEITGEIDELVKVTIKKTAGADGYRVYMKADGEKSYKNIKEIAKKGTSVRTYTTDALEDGRTYKFKVRAYKKVDGKKVWGDYSSVKTVVIVYDDEECEEDEEAVEEPKILTLSDVTDNFTPTVFYSYYLEEKRAEVSGGNHIDSLGKQGESLEEAIEATIGSKVKEIRKDDKGYRLFAKDGGEYELCVDKENEAIMLIAQGTLRNQLVARSFLLKTDSFKQQENRFEKTFCIMTNMSRMGIRDRQKEIQREKDEILGIK